MNNFIDIGLYVAYVLLALTILGVVVFPILQTFSDFKKARTGLLGFFILVVVLVLAYVISPADQGLFYSNFNIGPKLSKAIGAGFFATYFVILLSALSILYSEVVKLIK